MNTLHRILTLAAVAVTLITASARVDAQQPPPQQDRPNRGNRQGGPGNFDPEQMRQRMMERYREQLGVAGATLPEAEDLQKAIDGKASADELKAKLGKLREAKKVKQANLAKAQDDLRKVLSVRQEAVCVVMGLLD